MPAIQRCDRDTEPGKANTRETADTPADTKYQEELLARSANIGDSSFLNRSVDPFRMTIHLCQGLRLYVNKIPHSAMLHSE